MCVFQTRQCVLSKQDDVWFPNKTMCAFRRTQVCFPNMTMCAFQTTPCVLSKQDNVCFPNKTLCGSQTGQCVVPKHENREDASDFAEFLMKSIAAPSKKNSHQRKNRSEQTTKQRRTKKFTGGRFATNFCVGYKI